MQKDVHSGKSVIGLSMFLNRRRISARLAAVQKYCCLRRSSLPTAKVRQGQYTWRKARCLQVVWSLGYRTEVMAAALLEDSIARS